MTKKHEDTGKQLPLMPVKFDFAIGPLINIFCLVLQSVDKKACPEKGTLFCCRIMIWE